MGQLRPIAVVETREFLTAAKKLQDDAERSALVAYLAYNPTAGDLIPGTGSVRKIRWSLEGRGKRGGARVIDFFHDLEMPLLLLDLYSKNRQENLTQAQVNGMRMFTKRIVEEHKRRRQVR